MANNLIDVLENYGLISTESVQRIVYELPFKQLEKIREEIDQSLIPHASASTVPDDSFSSFNFLASASFRGDTGCSSWACHIKKADILARYAAIFCDRLVVPLDIASHFAYLSQSDQRYGLVRGLLSVVEMRPVIDAEIVIPVRAAHYYCPSVDYS